MIKNSPKQVLKRIIKIVIALHLSLMLIAVIDYKRKPKRTRLLAQKVLKESFHKPILPPKKTQLPVSTQKKAPQKTAQTPPKKEAPKKTVPKKAATPSKVAKIESKKVEPLPSLPPIETPQKPTFELILPKAIAKLESEQELAVQTLGELEHDTEPYRTYFEDILKSHLNLKPGVYVHLLVRLSKEGRVLEVKPTRSSDAFYKDFIVANIKHLQFARFFGEIANEPEYTFDIALQGDE